ncbi:hypothetical protein SPHV1_170055 [Novosphingobium sp. KN65.2]|nr:hypothetical protein SPHV1_170055 [Novosphingobium sp. KN65.2]
MQGGGRREVPAPFRVRPSLRPVPVCETIRHGLTAIKFHVKRIGYATRIAPTCGEDVSVEPSPRHR